MCIHLNVILSRWCFVIVSEFSYFPVPKKHLPFIQGSPGNAAMPLMDLSAPNGVMLWSFSSSSFNKWMHPSFAFEKFGMGTNGKLTFFCKGFFLEQKTKKHLYIYIYTYISSTWNTHLPHLTSFTFAALPVLVRRTLTVERPWKAEIMDGIWCSWRPLNQRQCALCQQLPVTPIDFGPSSLAAWVCHSKPSHGPHHLYSLRSSCWDLKESKTTSPSWPQDSSLEDNQPRLKYPMEVIQEAIIFYVIRSTVKDFRTYVYVNK